MFFKSEGYIGLQAAGLNMQFGHPFQKFLVNPISKEQTNPVLQGSIPALSCGGTKSYENRGNTCINVSISQAFHKHLPDLLIDNADMGFAVHISTGSYLF